MPNSPKTPTRTVRVPDALWNEAKVKTAARGTTITNVILDALRAYTDDVPDEADALWQQVWESNSPE